MSLQQPLALQVLSAVTYANCWRVCRCLKTHYNNATMKRMAFFSVGFVFWASEKAQWEMTRLEPERRNIWPCFLSGPVVQRVPFSSLIRQQGSNLGCLLHCAGSSNREQKQGLFFLFWIKGGDWDEEEHAASWHLVSYEIIVMLHFPDIVGQLPISQYNFWLCTSITEKVVLVFCSCICLRSRQMHSRVVACCCKGSWLWSSI